MSQFGMQMPGARQRRAASINVYTGLAFIAVVALLAAVALTWVNAAQLAPDGKPWTIHPEGQSIRLPQNT